MCLLILFFYSRLNYSQTVWVARENVSYGAKDEGFLTAKQEQPYIYLLIKFKKKRYCLKIIMEKIFG